MVPVTNKNTWRNMRVKFQQLFKDGCFTQKIDV